MKKTIKSKLYFADEEIELVHFPTGHGDEFNKIQLPAYQSMLVETAAVVKAEIKAGTRMEEMKKNRILAPCQAYPHGYFSCDDWLEILYANFQWQETMRKK